MFILNVEHFHDGRHTGTIRRVKIRTTVNAALANGWTIQDTQRFRTINGSSFHVYLTRNDPDNFWPHARHSALVFRPA